jgi:hypothetical protein
MKKIADSTPGTANLGNQNNFHAPRLLAKALVWKRTGEASYRRQVEEGIRAAIGTEENRSPDQQLLAMSRPDCLLRDLRRHYRHGRPTSLHRPGPDKLHMVVLAIDHQDEERRDARRLEVANSVP